MSEKFKFANAYKKLEEINEWFQKENIDLDEAIEKYKQGMELIKKCKERLKEAENKFEDIKEKYSVEGGVEENNNENDQENKLEEVDSKDIPF